MSCQCGWKNKFTVASTSQLAETSINNIINERQKNQKMSWSRTGAHNILQIRTSLFSKGWQADWTYARVCK